MEFLVKAAPRAPILGKILVSCLLALYYISSSASVHNWCIANKLRFNPAKLSLLIIPPKLNRQQPFITLNLNNISLPPYKSVKYLGVYIDEQFKLVADGKYRDHVTLFYSQLNVLKLLDLVKHETAKIVHRIFIPIFLHYCRPSSYILVKYLHESPEQSTPHAALLFTSLGIPLIDCKEA